MKLSIIIPAYNEEKRIVRTLQKSIAYLNGQEYQSEIIVVCDGNSDRTQDVARSFDRPGSMVSIKALRYEPNRGKGYAVRYGMLIATGEIAMFMDADYAVPIAEIEKGLRLLDQGCDIAIASRAVAGSVTRSRQNIFREISAKLYTFIQSIYLGINYKDTQCGFKLFKKEAADRLFEKQKLSSVIFDPEILWLAQKAGYEIGEFPVEWTHVEDSQIVYDSLKKSLFIFQELFRIKGLHR